MKTRVSFVDKRVGIMVVFDDVRTMKFYYKGIKVITTDGDSIFIEHDDYTDMTIQIHD